LFNFAFSLFFILVLLASPHQVNAQGLIVAHGGGTAFTHGKPPKLWKSFVHPFKKAGGKRAKILTVSSRKNDADRQLFDLLKSAGYKNVKHLETGRKTAVQDIQWADVIYFDSGVQTQLMRKLKARPDLLAAIRQAHSDGTIIAGSSAGAAVMSDVMICCDKGGKAIESRGLGLLSRIVIDQHYTQRERQFRLRQIISKHKDKLGVGIDESTAVVFDGNKMTVIGAPEDRRRSGGKFQGCKRIKGIYTCTCGAFCDCNKRKGIFVEGGIKRQCTKSLKFGDELRHAVTLVRYQNGKIVETELKAGKSIRLGK